TVTITAIQPRLRLSGTNRLGFQPSMAISVCEGQVIGFTTPNGEEISGRIVEIEPTKIQLDFNHPLSGKTFFFKTTILDVNPPE
ncbi:MAG: hypothetical protein KZQ65_06060, partial [Candidatus Thiodiazotropha sp. (ex Gloverina cf. vestifex)]|nr:hypothetical protein [Candidatus Thiodiazotropha sp. (ex Gloverina cf. vestifex)]